MKIDLNNYQVLDKRHPNIIGFKENHYFTIKDNPHNDYMLHIICWIKTVLNYRTDNEFFTYTDSILQGFWNDGCRAFYMQDIVDLRNKLKEDINS